MNDSERERFEKWVKAAAVGSLRKTDNGVYQHRIIHNMWCAWQEARRWIPVSEERPPYHEIIQIAIWLPVPKDWDLATVVIGADTRLVEYADGNGDIGYSEDDIHCWRAVDLPEPPDEQEAK